MKTKPASRLSIPTELGELADAVQGQSGSSYLVGGCVRDHLLGYELKDWDVEVFGLPSKALERLLRSRGRVNAVGRSFGVFKWRPRGWRGDEIDVSIPRRDNKVGPGHKGISVEGDPEMSLEEAVRRRDLKINALMIDLCSGELLDLVDGLGDLESRRLDAVDKTTFLEDPLRALRAVQFASRLGFEPTPALVALCLKAELHELPAERVQTEWGKLLLRGTDLPLGFQVAERTGVLERVFPGTAKTPKLQPLIPQRDAMPLGPAWALMLTAWLHHTPAAAEPTLDRLWLHKVDGYRVRDNVVRAINHYADPIETDGHLRWLSTRAELRVLLTARSAHEDVESASARAKELGLWTTQPKRLLEGRHLPALGVKPGPEMGRIVREVYEAQLDGRVATVEDAQALARSIVG